VSADEVARARYVALVEQESFSWRERRALGVFVRRFPEIHLGIGLVGNAVFLVGTVLFMAGPEAVGIWFFLVGSSGMFLGALGEVLRVQGMRRLWRTDTDPVNPSERWSETGRSASSLE
jgi:YrhK-like protein